MASLFPMDWVVQGCGQLLGSFSPLPSSFRVSTTYKYPKGKG